MSSALRQRQVSTRFLTASWSSAAAAAVDKSTCMQISESGALVVADAGMFFLEVRLWVFFREDPSLLEGQIYLSLS